MLDGEMIELLKHGYQPCTYIQLYCGVCGTVRLATAFPPQDE
jgi:hypothetical protein